jgi:hypothetical protein
MVSSSTVQLQQIADIHELILSATGVNGTGPFSSLPYSLSRLDSFLAGSAAAEQQTSQDEASQKYIDIHSHSPKFYPPSGINQGGQSSEPFDASQPPLFTPNTQALLQDFFNVPSPAKEVTANMATSLSAADLSHQVALLPYTHPAPNTTRNALFDAGLGAIQQRLPMYQHPTLLPTGLNLSSLAPPDSLDFSQMFTSMDSEAAEYHFSLPINLTTLHEYSAIPQIEQEQQEQQQTTPLTSIPTSSDGSSKPDGPQTDFDLGWFTAVDSLNAGKRTKNPIDVPPFVREKLLRSFFYNLTRCPCCYVDRDRFEQRLRLSPEARPHPAWLFSIVS